MGKCLHVIKKVETCGEAEYFNWNFDEFADLLSLMGVCIYSIDEYNRERFEVQKDEFVQAMEDLKAIKNGKTDFDDFDVEDLNFEILGGIDYVLKAMEDFYNECDKDCSYMIFVAW